MLWIIVMLMCCLPIAVSEDCKKTEIVQGRLGEELVLKFSLSDLKDEYNHFISEQFIEKTTQNEIQNKDLENESYIQFKKKMDSLVKYSIYENGKQTKMAGKLTEIFMTNDAFVVKKTKLQKKDGGIYWIAFKYITLGQKAVIITGKNTIIRQSPPNPLLKPEDNYTSIVQLDCYSVSTSIIGDCITMYTVWYKNEMRMTDVDPTLSQINVTIDLNGGNLSCLATDYLPCYQRLQNTTIYEVLNIEECNDVFESETFILQPEYPPIVQLEPDQREIIVNTNDDLLVRCSAKCHPKCEIRWEKEFQVLKSNGSIFITENIYGKDLKIVNVNSSHEGFYFCLINNTYEEARKSFTFSVTETEDKVLNDVDNNDVVIAVIVTSVIIVAVIVIVIVIVVYRKYHIMKYKPDGNGLTGDGSEQDDHIYDSISELDQDELLPETSTDNNCRNGEPGTSRDNNCRNGEPGTSRDNNSRNGEPGTSRDNNSRNGEPGTSSDNNSRDGELGISRDNNYRNGEPETTRDNNSSNSEPGTSTDNNSRDVEPEISIDDNSRNGGQGASININFTDSVQNMKPESHTYDSLQFKKSKRKKGHGSNPDSEHRYTRLQRTPEWFRVLLRKKIADAMSHDRG